MNLFGIIYKATNKVNSKIYIGQTTVSLAKRKSKHLYDASNMNNNSIFLKAINKYGIDSFEWEKIQDCFSRQELDDKENYYIRFFDSNNIEKGYNLVTGRGRSGYTLSEESKIKLSQKAIERFKDPRNNPMYGKHHSEETKKILRALKKDKFNGERNPFYGKTHSQESRAKMSESRIGKYNHFYGKHLSEEHCIKISNAHKNRFRLKMEG
jgi:group I intron endonuclease